MWSLVVILIMSLGSVAALGNAHDRSRQEFRGYIKIDGSLGRVPQLRILFDGRETMNNTEGFFSFLGNECDEYHLVITKKIEQNFDKTNTLKNVGIVSGKDYRCFSFKRSAEGMWVQSEKNLNKKDSIIPERAIVVLVSPSLVERIEPWNLDFARNTIKVPTIVLKKDSSHKELHRSAAKSLLYSLDAKTFHEPVKEIEQQPANNSKVRVAITHSS